MQHHNPCSVGPRWLTVLAAIWLAAGGCTDGTVAPKDDDTETAAEPDTAGESPPEDAQDTAEEERADTRPDEPSDDTGTVRRDTGKQDSGPAPDTAPAEDTGSSKPSTIRFIVMGDTGEGDQDQMHVAAGAQKRCDRAGGCHGFIMLGDNIYDTGPDSAQDKQFTTKIDKPYRQLKYGAPPASGQPDNRRRMPIYVSLGNHDLGGAGLESSLIQHYIDYGKSRPWFYYPSEFWEKQVGNVHLISIHTNPLAYLGSKEESQGKLVDGVLQSTTADWTIVFGHHPYRSNGQHGNAGTYEGIPGDLTPNGGDYREWVNDHVCDKVDFLLTGHDHNRQWIEKMPELTGDLFGGGTDDICETHMAVSGAGAKTRDMEDRDNKLLFGKPTLGFLFMEFDQTEKRVDVEYCDADGKTEWTKTITK